VNEVAIKGPCERVTGILRLSMAAPTTTTVLDALTRERLFDLGRIFGAGLRAARQAKAVVAASLGETLGDKRLLEILRELGRDELRGVCRAHSLDHDKASRPELIGRIAEAAGVDPTQDRARRQHADRPRYRRGAARAV
jgi:hypothetical protein